MIRVRIGFGVWFLFVMHTYFVRLLVVIVTDRIMNSKLKNGSTEYS